MVATSPTTSAISSSKSFTSEMRTASFTTRAGRPRLHAPTWAGLLSPERQAAIEAQDANNFAWGPRSIKLWEELEAANSDLITLAECDHYEDFWQGRLNAAGYGSVWRQRPREASRDGCLIGWRDATFELIAEGGCAVGDSFGEQQQGRLDRTLLLALLRFRRCPSERVLIATTHLARNPEKRELARCDLRRGVSVWPPLRELLAFAQAHDAVDVPCIITGDLNAQSVDDLSGLTKAVAIACGGVEEVHPIISCVQDAPTPPTTKTDARCFRIDYVLYQSTKLRLIKVGAIPPLLEPMPNERMPSDHVPVSVKFAFRSPHSQLEADARQWLNAMSDARSVRPLSAAELRRAFAFFDKDGSEIITPIELAAGMQSLNYGASSNLSAQRVREAVRRPQASLRTASWMMMRMLLRRMREAAVEVVMRRRYVTTSLREPTCAERTLPNRHHSYNYVLPSPPLIWMVTVS